MADGKADRRGKYVEVETALLNEFEQLPAKNGTTFRFELEDAMRRHLAYPPRREPEPLPDAAAYPDLKELLARVDVRTRKAIAQHKIDTWPKLLALDSSVSPQVGPAVLGRLREAVAALGVPVPDQWK